MKWRTIFTGSESETGIAPVCDRPDIHAMQHGEGPGSHWVYDCCPQPHIECHGEASAQALAVFLTALDAEPEGS